MTRGWLALCLLNLLLMSACAVNCCDGAVDVHQSADAWPF